MSDQIMKLRKAASFRALIYLAYLRRQKPRSKLHKKCAIFKLDSLGDGVLALGAIRSITRRFGEENCALVCWKRLKALMASQFPAMEIVGADLQNGTLLPTIRYLNSMRQHRIFAQGVELLISLCHHRSMHTDLVMSAIPAETTIGSPNTWLSDFGFDRIKKSRLRFDKTSSPIVEPGDNECRELACHRAVLTCAFSDAIESDEIFPKLPLNRIVENSNRLMIAPFAGVPIRDMEADQIKRILLEIPPRHKFETLMVSSPADEGRLKKLAAGLKEDGFSSILTRCTENIEALIRTLSEGGVLLAPESGPAHLATALDIPSVILLGGGHHGWFAPWRRSTKQVWVDNRVPCYSCNWQCIYNEPICLTEISAKTVAAEIIRRLPITNDGIEKRHDQF